MRSVIPILFLAKQKKNLYIVSHKTQTPLSLCCLGAIEKLLALSMPPISWEFLESYPFPTPQKWILFSSLNKPIFWVVHVLKMTAIETRYTLQNRQLANSYPQRQSQAMGNGWGCIYRLYLRSRSKRTEVVSYSFPLFPHPRSTHTTLTHGSTP